MISSRLTRRSLIAAIGGFGVGRSGFAQTPVASPEPIARIPRLRVGVRSSPQSVAPNLATDMDSMWLSSLVYDAPYRWNTEGRVITGLFTPTSRSRSTVISLEPRLSAMFSDGTLVDSNHAVRALTLVLDSPQQWRLQNVSELSALPNGTLQIRLDGANVALNANLSHPVFGLHADGLGTGPFVLKDSTESSATLIRNSLFWQVGRPYIETLDLIRIADDTERSLAITTGQIDLLPNVPLLDVPMLVNEPTVYLVGGPSNRLCHLQLRLSAPVLANRRVRQILSGAIDRTRLVTVATANQAEPTSKLLAGEEWTETIPEVEAISPNDVREELRALGVPSDLRLHLLADNADSTLANTAVVLQEQLANCGISLSITLLEDEDLQTAREEGDFDLLVSYSEPWRDPQELVWPLLASEGPLNWSTYSSIEVDTLLHAANALSDLEFRRARYTRLEGIIQRDVPVIPLFKPYVWDAVRADFAGYTALPPVTSRGLMTVRPADSP